VPARRHPRSQLVALALATGLLLAGCGSDGGDGGTDAAAPATTATSAPTTSATAGAGGGRDYGGGDYGAGGAGGAAEKGEVRIADLAFAPAELEVNAGDQVVWENADGTTHTVTADQGGFDSGNLPVGDRFDFAFDRAGTFAYHCEIHPSMQGTVVVG
jgi:plastocyanin